MPHGEGVRKEQPHLVPVRAEPDRAQADQVAGREGARVRQQGQKHLLREPVPPLDVRELGREALGALRPGPDFCVKPSSCLGLLVAQRPPPLDEIRLFRNQEDAPWVVLCVAVRRAGAPLPAIPPSALRPHRPGSPRRERELSLLGSLVESARKMMLGYK